MRLEGAADFIIEVASDSDPSLDVREKLPRYREAGVEEMWFIDRFGKVVRVEQREAAGYVSTMLASGRLESTVVPGFWIRCRGCGASRCRRRSRASARFSARSEPATSTETLRRHPDGTISRSDSTPSLQLYPDGLASL
jgi:Putative restriction endonuclease